MSDKKMLKKKHKLGMNPSTAQHRLTKDLLFYLVQIADLNKCHRCDTKMTRENFSVDHIVPWLNSDNPVGLYFDIKNVAFSHLSCNSSASRGTQKYFTDEERREAKRQQNKKYHTSERRRAQYLKTGQ